MTTAAERLTSPGIADFEESRSAAAAAANTVEAIAFRLRALLAHAGDRGSFPEGVIVDAAFIGELFSYCVDMDAEVSQLAQFVTEARGLLEQLDGYRWDFSPKSRSQVSAS